MCACTHILPACTEFLIRTCFCPQLPSGLTSSCALHRSPSVDFKLAREQHPLRRSPEPDTGPDLVPGHPSSSPWHVISFPLPGFPSLLEIGKESRSDSQLHPGKAWGLGEGVGCGGCTLSPHIKPRTGWWWLVRAIFRSKLASSCLDPFAHFPALTRAPSLAAPHFCLSRLWLVQTFPMSLAWSLLGEFEVFSP